MPGDINTVQYSAQQSPSLKFVSTQSHNYCIPEALKCARPAASSDQVQCIMASEPPFEDTTHDLSAAHTPNGELHEPFDDDLLNAALLFLDQPYEDTDSDSNSTHNTHSSESDLEPDFGHVHEASHEPTPSRTTSDAVFRGLGPAVDAKATRRTTADVVKLAQATTVLDATGNPVHVVTKGQSFRPLRRHRVNKQKIEVDALRLEVAALEDRIKELQVQPVAAVTPHNVGLLMSAALVSTWEKVAAQQQERLARSEAGNRRLKELVAEHRRLARSLRRIAVRHTNSKSWVPIRPPPIHSVSSHTVSELENPTVYEMLRMSLDQMLAQTESAVAFDLGRDFKAERHGDSHFAVKIQDARCVPFALEKAAAAVWDHTLYEEDIQNLQYTVIDDGSAQSKFVSYVDLGDIHGQVEGKLVVRRIDEPNRTVILRHSLFHCLAVAHKNRFLALPIHHFLWIVVDRPPQFSQGPGQDMISRIRRCAVTLPRLDAGDASDPNRDAEVQDLLRMNTQVATQLCDLAHDAVDNLLMGTGAPLGSKMIPWQAAVDSSVKEGDF